MVEAGEEKGSGSAHGESWRGTQRLAFGGGWGHPRPSLARLQGQVGPISFV